MGEGVMCRLEEKKKPARKKSPLAIGGFIAVLLSQGKLLLAALKLGKVGGAIISMFITIWAYAYLAPLPFAIGIVLMILIHEWSCVCCQDEGASRFSTCIYPFSWCTDHDEKESYRCGNRSFYWHWRAYSWDPWGRCRFWIGVYFDSPVIVSVAYAAFYLI